MDISVHPTDRRWHTVHDDNRVKRLCFDTESNYWKPAGSSVGTPEEHREYLRDRKIRFDCAVVYDAQSRRYRSFTSEQLDHLVELLASADELVSHSGRRVDLIVLEHLCGEERVAPLWSIPHHDLLEVFCLHSVASLAQTFVYEERLSEMERAYRRRLAWVDRKWPVVNEWRSQENFIGQRMAKARFDVERIWAVYREHCKCQKRVQDNPR